MANYLILFYTKSGNTKKMANAIYEGIKNTELGASDFNLDLYNISDNNIVMHELENYDCIIVGAPIHYGKLASPMNDFLESSFENNISLEDKIGGCFTSYGVDIQGAELAILSLVQFFLEQGMIVPGINKEEAFGQIIAGTPDDEILSKCREYGQKIAHLTKSICT
ncbi:flavodoxin family protein [Natranaerofaba carboxydovora]|uniref:flavodoxin family protein n=1 Tax=Natranaerofaba carboxydovora TaxID=2742683 RepID=UPI001F1354D1|nr:flavodoxin family protein [Natranaerofaba carboxydovora]UMZ74150.1 NAD(P)H dehydrogenase (quinone) [Natranaerofaba carboxydovora]